MCFWGKSINGEFKWIMLTLLSFCTQLPALLVLVKWLLAFFWRTACFIHGKVCFSKSRIIDQMTSCMNYKPNRNWRRRKFLCFSAFLRIILFITRNFCVQQVLEVGCAGSMFTFLDLLGIHRFFIVNSQCFCNFVWLNVCVTSHLEVFRKFLGISSRCVISLWYSVAYIKWIFYVLRGNYTFVQILMFLVIIEKTH